LSKTYAFTCSNEKLLLGWIKAIRTALGQPCYTTPKLITNSETLARDSSSEERRVSINGVKPTKLLVFVNPFGGTGTAMKVWRQVQPMFLLANIDLHVVETKHGGHAGEMVSTLDLSRYNGIVTVSGDGLLNEVVNALLRRPDWKEASKMPLGLIPGGSSNGLSSSIGCFTPNQAAFAIIKGRTRPLDVFSLLQEGQKKRFGFLDVAWGFVSDVDFGSETFRWMGKARLTITALEKLIHLNRYPARISFVPAEFSPIPCVQVHCPTCASAPEVIQPSLASGAAVREGSESLYQGEADSEDEESDRQKPEQKQYSTEHEEGEKSNGLSQEEDECVGPPLRYISRHKINQVEWKVIEDHFCLFVASNVRGISGDTFLTTYAHLSDGCLDICYMRSGTRSNLFQALWHNSDGSHLNIEGIEYAKVKALIIEPLIPAKPKRIGKMGIDGEILLPTTVKVEVHRALLSIFHPCS